MVADASAKDQKQLQGKSCGRSPHQRHGICSVCPDVGHLIHVGVLRRLFVSKYVFLIGRFVSGNIGLVSSGRDAVVGDRNGRFTPGNSICRRTDGHGDQHGCNELSEDHVGRW